MKRDWNGKFLGSYKFNRATRNRSDDSDAEDWTWYDKD